jgi:hypothetical protein
LLTELGIRTPWDGVTLNYVNLNLYDTAFKFGFKIVNGNYDVWFTGQKPKSYAYGIDIYNAFLYLDIIFFITYDVYIFYYFFKCYKIK